MAAETKKPKPKKATATAAPPPDDLAKTLQGRLKLNLYTKMRQEGFGKKVEINISLMLDGELLCEASDWISLNRLYD